MVFMAAGHLGERKKDGVRNEREWENL